jgi:hypothetical protein
MMLIGFMGRHDGALKGLGSALIVDAARRVHRNPDLAAWGLMLDSEGGPGTKLCDVLIKQMFAIPAHTADGRRAKVTVLFTCIMPSEWRTETDKDADYEIEMARKLLIEFIGGEPGKMLRDQFA